MAALLLWQYWKQSGAANKCDCIEHNDRDDSEKSWPVAGSRGRVSIR